jgi:thiosulfate/3-mercaptopyruvate sulfurtransferase
MDNLVSTEWLAGELGKPDLLVFDATIYLPNENKHAPTEFAAAHIPGAGFFDVDAIADQETSLPHMAPTAGRFARLVGELGVSNSHRVVIYDQRGIFSAPRAWWMFRLFGHDPVAVLDGGLPKWKAEGRPTAGGSPAEKVLASFWADFRARKLAGIGDVKRVVESGEGPLLLDARARGRFEGSAPEPRPGLPSGHMPGARNLPATELLNPDFTMLSPAELRAKFAAAGVDGSREVITTCGTGVTACVLALGLERAGYAPATVYDGSWTEWAARPETPKEVSA